MWSVLSVYSENVYLMLAKKWNEKSGIFKNLAGKGLKEVSKTSREMWRWIRSKTKLEARYTIIILWMLKFTLSMDRLRINVVFFIKSSLLLHKANPVYLYIPCINIIL